MSLDDKQGYISTLCPNNATCVQVRALPDGWYGLTDTKDPGGPTLTFNADELDAFATAWLAGKFGNKSAAALDPDMEATP